MPTKATLLAAIQTALAQEDLEVLRSVLGEKCTKSIIARGDGSKPHVKRKKSGYNYFLGQELKKLAKSNLTRPERMNLVISKWSAMTQDEKDHYKKLGEEESEGNTSIDASTTHTASLSPSIPESTQENAHSDDDETQLNEDTAPQKDEMNEEAIKEKADEEKEADEKKEADEEVLTPPTKVVKRRGNARSAATKATKTGKVGKAGKTEKSTRSQENNSMLQEEEYHDDEE